MKSYFRLIYLVMGIVAAVWITGVTQHDGNTFLPDNVYESSLQKNESGDDPELLVNTIIRNAGENCYLTFTDILNLPTLQFIPSIKARAPPILA